MTDAHDSERRISSWFEEEEAGTRYPDRLLRSTFENTRELRQARSLGWGSRPTVRSFTSLAGAAAIVLLVAGVFGLSVVFDRAGPAGSPGPASSSTPQPSEQVSPPVDSAEAAALLNAFVDARIAGRGAEQFIKDPGEVPLLYATTSGVPYDRAEFEQVRGIDWPYGYTAFKVRSFAGDTVVEQLIFSPNGAHAGLGYDPDGYGTDIAPATEDGQPVPLEYQYFNGALTLQAAHPWVMSDYGVVPFGRLIPEGPGVAPTTDGGQRHDWVEVFLMADPPWVGTGCQAADPGDAEAHARSLAESIQSDPGLVATTPVAVSPGRWGSIIGDRVGPYEAFMMDVRIATAGLVCVNVSEGTGDPTDHPGVLYPLMASIGSFGMVGDEHLRGPASGDVMRLYLMDVPATSGMQWLAIAIVAPESSFERATAAAEPLVNAIEVHS